jgi:hypothetical protein
MSAQTEKYIIFGCIGLSLLNIVIITILSYGVL